MVQIQSLLLFQREFDFPRPFALRHFLSHAELLDLRFRFVKKGEPELTISPTDTSIEITLPTTEAGISIAALSDSKTMIGSSEST